MKRLWLWKNFVGGKPEYWAFDNPYPVYPSGDPMTLGEPCGYALVMASETGRFDVSEAEVIAAIKRASPPPEVDALPGPAYLAKWFHDTYETLAPEYGYETKPETKVFDPRSANGQLMIAVCRKLKEQLRAEPQGDRT